MSILKKLVVIGVSSVLYYASLWLNDLIWGETEFSFDVHWVFFPSGIRFILVLLALEWLGGMLWNFQDHPDLGLEFALITGLIAGLSPVIARRLSIQFLDLDPEFKVVSPLTLLKISILFATLSALLHQIWFSTQGLTEHFSLSLGVMAMSNLAGTWAVLMIFKMLLQSTAKPPSNLDP
ncbi:MAG: hypothetical protein EBU20_08130 [Betaproteobacteria bacterium]|nr:hypothetical protein [Betaproteobacteria bacterium]